MGCPLLQTQPHKQLHLTPSLRLKEGGFTFRVLIET